MKLQSIIKEMYKRLITFILMFLVVIKKGSAMQITSSITWISAPFAFLMKLLTDYVFPVELFIKFFFIGLISDTVLGAYRHWKERSFSGDELFRGMLEKLGLSFMGMAMVKALIEMPNLMGELNIVAIWFLHIAIILYIGGSVLANMYIISKGKFPPPILMKRFDKFSETLNPDDLLPSDKKEVNKIKEDKDSEKE